jgi:hypothetical protein
MTTWLVAQLGCRMHYAVPRILSSAGMLEALYTDVCSAAPWANALRGLAVHTTPPLQRLAGRVPEGVPATRIHSFPVFGLRYAARRAAARTPEDLTAVHLWAGESFCNSILRRGLGEAGAVYTFNSAGLELLRHARQLGLRTVVEQTIAPAAIEDELLDRERAAFPTWQPESHRNGNRAAFREREAAEWEHADLILCASEFVRDGIRACGGPVERVAVVPYGVNASAPAGAAGLRKGTPYLLDAARMLAGVAEFRLVGDVTVSPSAARQLSESLELTGPVPRVSMAQHFAWADVFVLPSICEGSATACYEALAAGLPVVATPNTGSAVRDGVEGFIVPARDAQAIAAAIDRLRTTPGLLCELSRNALLRAREFTVQSYGDRLLKALSGAAEPEAAPVLSH